MALRVKRATDGGGATRRLVNRGDAAIRAALDSATTPEERELAERIIAERERSRGARVAPRNANAFRR